MSLHVRIHVSVGCVPQNGMAICYSSFLKVKYQHIRFIYGAIKTRFLSLYKLYRKPGLIRKCPGSIFSFIYVIINIQHESL